jgi:hypothetical protein
MPRIEQHLVKHENGCWTLGAYGGNRAQIRYRGKNFSARTLLWEQLHGKIPAGRQLRADCRDKKCVNPFHCRVASGTMEQRLETWSKKKENGCIEWFGCVGGGGYGLIRVLGKNYPAHRVAYSLRHGKIPKGMVVCHHCDNPPCVNVDHLFLGTVQDNATDMVEKGRANCGVDHHSHKLNPEKVLQIRSRYQEGESVCSLSKEFGIGPTSTQKVIDRVTWKHVHAKTH